MKLPPLSLGRIARRRLTGLAAGLAGAWLLLAVPPAAAREVRVATYNILNGTGATGSAEYEALRAILARMDADIVCFQELQTTSFATWTNLAAELGYAHTAFSGNGPFSGNLYNGYYSRFPILSTHNVSSPPGAVELSRYPFRAVIDVPDTQRPLVLWTMHHKASAGSGDKFRRAIEAYRIVQDVDAYLAANPDHVEYVLTGDMNDDIRDSQTPAQFNSQPTTSDMPASYVLGSDITFPVAYATFPADRYAGAGHGMIRMPAFWESSTTPVTRPSSDRQLDYVFLSPALMNNPLGAPRSEVYYSVNDLGGGLPKWGDPLPAATSTNASDHLPIFVDFFMADFSSVLPTAGFFPVGEAGGPFEPEYKTYTLTETNGFETFWSVASDVAWLSTSHDRFWLAPFEPFEVDVFLNANAAALPPGVHAGAIAFSNETTGLLETRAVALTVRDHLAVSPADGLAAGGTVGGPFTPASKTYSVTNKSALAIAFTATAAENWLTVSPSLWLLQPGQSVEVQVALNANALGLPIGAYADTVVFSNQVTGLAETRPVSLSIAGALCDAVDACDLAWTTGGNAEWFHQTEITFDGIDAARSGAIGTSQQSWMETEVAGPVNVSFQWKVSSRSTHYLRFLVDGVSVASLSGETAWTNRSHEIATGIHTLRWSYATTTTSPQGSNAGWVDQVALDYLTATPTGTWSASGTPGGPFSPATQTYVLTNSGPGALPWTVIPAVDWISAAPASGELEPGGSAMIELSLNEIATALAAGTYSGSVVFSNQTTGGAFLRQATLAVQDYLVITPAYSWHTGFAGGPYTPAAQTYALSNSGPAAMEWTVATNACWVGAEPSSGTIAPGAASQVVVSLNESADVLPAGWNYAQLTFSNATTTLVQSRWVYLQLLESLAVTAPGWAPSGPVGGPFAPASAVYVLTNQSNLARSWTVAASANWLSLSAAGGSLASNSSTEITASLNANATALPMGVYSAALVFSNPSTGPLMTQTVALAVGVVFCEGVDACDLDWTFGGNAPWLYQTNFAKDGVDAAASGTITHDEESWMETAVTGPGNLSFWWKVSSEANWDYLEFWIDGVRTNLISGTVDWQLQTHTLAAGPHRLRWRYMKDGSVNAGSDQGWVDLVAWAPARTLMGVPIVWYQRFGLAPDEGAAWDTLDWRPAAAGAPNWFQYVSGLTPTDPTDAFRILDIRQAAGEPVRIDWWGGTNGPANPYVVESTLDAETDPWEALGSSPRTAGLNTWTGDEPADRRRVYRILALPDPVP